jgi:hypothetical protein
MPKYVVSKAPRENYAEIMGNLIRSLAEEQGVSEAEYRAMIETPKGREIFRFVCGWYGVPLFECRYRQRKSLIRFFPVQDLIKGERNEDRRGEKRT